MRYSLELGFRTPVLYFEVYLGVRTGCDIFSLFRELAVEFG